MFAATGDRLFKKASMEVSITIRWRIEDDTRCKDRKFKFVLYIPVSPALPADEIVIQESVY